MQKLRTLLSKYKMWCCRNKCLQTDQQSLMHQQWGFFWAVLSGCDQCQPQRQPAVIGAFPVLEYISCPSLVCSTEHTIFPCTTGRKLGHRGRQGAVRLPCPEQMVGQVWEHPQNVWPAIERELLWWLMKLECLELLSHSVGFLPSVLGILVNDWVGFCVLIFLFKCFNAFLINMDLVFKDPFNYSWTLVLNK